MTNVEEVPFDVSHHLSAAVKRKRKQRQDQAAEAALAIMAEHSLAIEARASRALTMMLLHLDDDINEQLELVRALEAESLRSEIEPAAIEAEQKRLARMLDRRVVIFGEVERLMESARADSVAVAEWLESRNAGQPRPHLDG